MYKFHFSIRAMLLLVLGCSVLSSNAQQFQSEIKTYLQENRSLWKLTAEDISNWTVSDQYPNKETGITYTYLHQQVSGIRIFNAVSTMAIRDHKVVYFANRFYSDAAGKINVSTPLLTPESAIAAAATHLGTPVTIAPVLQSTEEHRERYVFNDCGISKKPVKVELMYVPTGNTFRLAWNVSIDMRKSSNLWNVRVDATSGAVIDKNNLTVSCNFGEGHTHSAPCMAEAKSVEALSKTTVAGSSYNVFALPLEAASFGGRSLLTDPNSTVASPYGWHDTDGVEGAEYTITQGNNVYAYDDRDADNQPGYSPDGGANLNFDFPLDLSLSPLDNQDAIITNLFYLNNTLHDILYLHGFDEVSGNFQSNNYGKGGLGNDYVLAEAQDGENTNNANFGTPDDGESGIMQMFLWPSEAPSFMKVNLPLDIAGDYTAVLASGGADLLSPVTGLAVLVDDGVDPTTDACEPIVNGAAITGKIVVIDRGTCSFVSKIEAAENAGAIAVIIINNVAGAPFSIGGSGSNIPTVMVSQADGLLIKNALTAGTEVNITLMSVGTANPDRDGSLDNGIVAHEYGHGLSNRLTGGPSNSGCLGNGEQGGEGWSDWLALILTIEPGDTGAGSRGIGTYALAEPTNGSGIRRYPYSTDMAINPQTYAELVPNPDGSGSHRNGEIWSQVLWDMTWKLIDAEGFDPDWYEGNGGNNTAMRLVLEGMKLQPCGPGFLDARDAILAADTILYNNIHSCLIWEAFAGRGMGFNAAQGSSDIGGDETANFDIPNICQTAVVPPTANFTVNATSSCFADFQFTDASTDIPQQWLWDFGDGTTSTAINPVHTYTVGGTYTVKLTVTNTLGTDNHLFTIVYEPLPTPVVSGDLSVCTGNSTTLTAEVSSGNSANWSLGNNLVYTGSVFNTPALSTTTTYTLEQVVDFPVGNAGPVDNTFAGGGNHNTGFDGRLLFEAYKPLTIISVLVYAQGAGERTISLYKEDGTLLKAVTLNVPNGSSRITLNLDVPEAGKYSLGNVSQDLYRNNAGANYPYILDNMLSIYSSNATGANILNYYYYFYDWEVKERGCTSAPVPVTVNVTPGPMAGFTFVADELNVSFSNISSGNPTSFSWNFGDGSPVSTVQNPAHTFTTPGTYTVTLTVTDGNCTNTTQKVVTVMTTGTDDVDAAFGLNVYPNPAANEVNIRTDGTLTGKILVDIFNAEGRQVISRVWGGSSTVMQLNTASLSAGIYQIRVTGKEGVVVRKVTIVR